MVQFFTLKVAALFAMLATVLANPELETEQPTKLLGGVLRKPEKCGYKVSSNAEIKLHYRARAWGEEEFYENTFLEEEPRKVKLGRDKLVKGLEQGIHGMCTGEVRRLLVPADLAYGELGLPNLVPANTAIIYEVEVIHVNSPFTNFWFWSGFTALMAAFLFFNRFNDFISKSKSSKFLEEKAQEKKSE